MPNLKEVRTRISSVISTQQITKAMKMVSASKLRKATSAILQIRPYTQKLDEIKNNVLANNTGELEIKLSEKRTVKNALVVLMTSDKGLCGGFNSNLLKAARTLIQDELADLKQSGNVTVMPLGKKGYDAAKKWGVNIDDRYVSVFQKLDFPSVSTIAEELMKGFLSQEFDSVHVVFSEFKNPAVQFFQAKSLLPLSTEGLNGNSGGSNIDYIFEPNPAEIIENLIPTFVKIQLFRCALDTVASEHGARMTAMDKATDNAGELLKSLRLEYNRARQAAITTEISEIVGGVAALEG
jgi:F-type H+-transporting ATPase subunit gamma